MANPEHLAILKQGVEVWNRWREENPAIKPDLTEADLSGDDLSGINFSKVILKKADLSEADLTDADLSKANLWFTDLSRTNLTEANLLKAALFSADLSKAILKDANLKKVDLEEANLSGADLESANLKKASLEDADLSKANFEYANLKKADMTNANFSQASLVDSNLDEAILTGVNLWESSRSGWSIKNVICAFVCFDRYGKKITEFSPGEFERLYSEKMKFFVHYQDGLHQFEVTTLPALIQFIENKHSGCNLRLNTIREDAGGASVTVVVEELGESSLQEIQDDFEDCKNKIREEIERDTQIEKILLEGQVKLLKDIIEKNMGNTFNIQQVTGIVNAESSTINQRINNDIYALQGLISEILEHRAQFDAHLPVENLSTLDEIIEVIRVETNAAVKDDSKLKKAAMTLKNLLVESGSFAANWLTVLSSLNSLGVHI